MKTKKIITFILLTAFLYTPFSVTNAGFLLSEKEKARAEAGKSKSENGPWLMSYYVGYQNGYLKPKDIDYTLMTHIVVGGIGVNANGTLDEHWHLTSGDGRDMALDIGRRADKAGVKKLVWLGGPNEQDKFYSATSDANRKKFVKNIVTLLDDLGYDGVDIDWEPLRSKDEKSIVALVKDLREADPDIIITVPVNWVQSNMVANKDMSVFKDIARYTDKMFIMSYSMSGPWSGWESWHGGALTGEGANTPGSVESSVDAYLKAGVPNEKLGIGIGTYATCWEYPIKKPNQKVPNSFTSSDLHVMSMRTMMEDYYTRRSVEWDKKAKVPYLSFKKAQGDFECGFISYENERSIEEKVSYMKKNDLGGVMIWNIGTGYFPENSKSKRNPLLKKAWEVLSK
jgi:chitinase